MNPPKVVVFDLGKVLLDFNFQIFADALAGESSVTADEIQASVINSDLLRDYEYGRTTSQQFFEQVKSFSKYRGDIQSFKNLFGEIFTEIVPMISLQQRLRKSGLPTYIFSNTNEIAIDTVRRLYPFFSGFTGYILSYEHLSMKPDTRIYEVVEDVIGASGSDLVFLDDKEENISAAQARGWHGIVHVNPEQSESNLRGLGLNFD